MDGMEVSFLLLLLAFFNLFKFLNYLQNQTTGSPLFPVSQMQWISCKRCLLLDRSISAVVESWWVSFCQKRLDTSQRALIKTFSSETFSAAPLVPSNTHTQGCLGRKSQAPSVASSCFPVKNSACSSDHQWCDRGESEQHQVPGCTHHRGPLLDQQHCSTSQESTTASLLPPQTQKSQSPGPHHVHLLQRHHREHSD